MKFSIYRFIMNVHRFLSAKKKKTKKKKELIIIFAFVAI